MTWGRGKHERGRSRNRKFNVCKSANQRPAGVHLSYPDGAAVEQSSGKLGSFYDQVQAMLGTMQCCFFHNIFGYNALHRQHLQEQPWARGADSMPR